MRKPKISSWSKLCKHLEWAFLPYNYEQSLFQKLHTLRQNTRSVNDYTKEFFDLVMRIDVRDSEPKLVVRYIAGLHSTLQDTLSMFMVSSLSEAYQRALLLDQQAGKRPSRSVSSPASSTTQPAHQQPSIAQLVQITGEGSSSGLQCYGCGEHEHRRSACPCA